MRAQNYPHSKLNNNRVVILIINEFTYVLFIYSAKGVPLREDMFLSWHLAPVSEVTRGLTLPF
jgi:hypothetical protein